MEASLDRKTSHYAALTDHCGTVVIVFLQQFYPMDDIIKLNIP